MYLKKKKKGKDERKNKIEKNRVKKLERRIHCGR